MENELHSRTLKDGSGTVIKLHQTDDGRFRVTAENGCGTSECIVDAADASMAFKHPFSRADWLDYPGVNTPLDTGAAMTPVEYALAEAIDAAVAGDSDAV